MKMSNSDIVKILMSNDHLSEEDKKVLLKILGYSKASNQKLPLGDRISDAFTNFIGSWSFIILSVIGIIIWIMLNTFILPEQYVFDKFPFVLLNLALACVASIQAPVIMMSQNRQDKRESLKTQSDYELDLKTVVIIQDLYSKTLDLCSKIDDLNAKIDTKDKGSQPPLRVVKSKSGEKQK